MNMKKARYGEHRELLTQIDPRRRSALIISATPSITGFIGSKQHQPISD
jgi:hypothetical protein